MLFKWLIKPLRSKEMNLGERDEGETFYSIVPRRYWKSNSDIWINIVSSKFIARSCRLQLHLVCPTPLLHLCLILKSHAEHTVFLFATPDSNSWILTQVETAIIS